MCSQELKNIELTTTLGRKNDIKKENIKPYDAVYIGDPFCELVRGNILEDEKVLRESVKTIKNLGKKVYLSTYVEPWSDKIQEIQKMVEIALKEGIDAVEVADLGVLRMVYRNFPKLDIHVSNFVNLFNKKSAEFLSGFNVKRIMPYPELSLKEIDAIKENIAVEIQVHGKIPLGYTELCIVRPKTSKKKTLCSGPCYNGSMLKRGEFAMMACGRVAFGSKDLCMLDYMNFLMDKGYQFFRVESRFERGSYRRTVGELYRRKIEMIKSGKSEPSMIDTNLVCNGVYFEKPSMQYVSKTPSKGEK